MQLDLLIFAYEWIYFFFTIILFLNFFLVRNAWKLCMAAPEQREFLLFPRTALACGLQAQKEASLLVEHMLQADTFFDTHYNFQQFHFQHIVLTLLHCPCSSLPWGVLLCIFWDLTSVLFSSQLLGHLRFIVLKFDISAFCSPCHACRVPSLHSLCAVALPTAVPWFAALYDVLMRLRHVGHIAAREVPCRYLGAFMNKVFPVSPV